MKKAILIALAAIIVIAGVGYWYYKKGDVSADAWSNKKDRGLNVSGKIVAMDSKSNVVLLNSMSELAFDKTATCSQWAYADRKNKTNWSNSRIPLTNVIYKDQLGILMLENGDYNVISPNYADKCYSSFIRIRQGYFVATGAVPAKDPCAYDYNGDKVLNSLDVSVLANMWRDKTEITTESVEKVTATDLKAYLNSQLIAKKATLEFNDIMIYRDKLLSCPSYAK